jgi:hypothetical protein
MNILMQSETEPKQILKTPHLLTLIRAVEDLETITPGIYAQCSSLFSAAIANYVASSSTTSEPTLSTSIPGMSKSIAGLRQSVSWNMVNSSESLTSENEAVTVPGGDLSPKRAWDWRSGAVHMKGKHVKPEDVMRVLRCQVAVEMGKVWI